MPFGHELDSISDESSFYGSEDEKQDLEVQASSFDVNLHWSQKHRTFADIKQAARNAVPIKNERLDQSLDQKQNARPSRRAYNMYEGRPCARQLDETVDEFLERLPPRATMSTEAGIGPWIFISYQYTGERPLNEDLAGFKEAGADLLSKSSAVAAEIEENMKEEGKSRLAITKAINAKRKDLPNQILELGRKHGIKGGKWMLRPSADRVNDTWAKVAKGVAAGELGHAAKVATNDGTGDRDARVICVYTKDFSDKNDVKRVVEELAQMGFCNKDDPKTRQIYYKADAYTYLDLMSGNEFGLKTSMYGSKDALNGAI